jgi:hypothetical protein
MLVHALNASAPTAAWSLQPKPQAVRPFEQLARRFLEYTGRAAAAALPSCRT